MEEILEKLGNYKILNLGEIIRYNNRPKIKHENVAEHSFYVASTVLKICKIFGLSEDIKHKALELAIVHDIPELLVGDIPYDTKVNNPELAKYVALAEVSELEKHLPEFSDSYKEFLKEEEEETVVYLVVKLADIVSVLQYSNMEIDLGNRTKDMMVINDDAIERVRKMAQKLTEILEKSEDK